MSNRLYATFMIDDMMFGVCATDVQEILRPQQLTRVPLADTEIGGLMNLRGQIVVTMDMRTRLGLPPTDDDHPPLNIILRTSRGPLSIVVDDVGDVFEALDEALVPPPETLRPPIRDLVGSVHKLDDRLLLILDVANTARLPVAQ